MEKSVERNGWKEVGRRKNHENGRKKRDHGKGEGRVNEYELRRAHAHMQLVGRLGSK